AKVSMAVTGNFDTGPLEKNSGDSIRLRAIVRRLALHDLHRDLLTLADYLPEDSAHVREWIARPALHCNADSFSEVLVVYSQYNEAVDRVLPSGRQVERVALEPVF